MNKFLSGQINLEHQCGTTMRNLFLGKNVTVRPYLINHFVSTNIGSSYMILSVKQIQIQHYPLTVNELEVSANI